MSGGSRLAIHFPGGEEEADGRFWLRVLARGAVLAGWWALGWVVREGLAFLLSPTGGVFSGAFLLQGSLQCSLRDWLGVITAGQRVGAEVPGVSGDFHGSCAPACLALKHLGFSKEIILCLPWGVTVVSNREHTFCHLNSASM